jgi:hypothetical protein
MISDSECQALKFHLGFGSIGADAEPYVDFVALFEQVIAPSLTTAPETSSASAIVPGVALVTPVRMTSIVPYARLIVDVGDDSETVVVQSTTATTYSARYQRAHPAGTPIAVDSGTARLRYLLHRADQAWAGLQDPSVGATAGLGSVDKNDVVWQPHGAVIRDRLLLYRAIQAQLGSLVRVTPRNANVTAVSVY